MEEGHRYGRRDRRGGDVGEPHRVTSTLTSSSGNSQLSAQLETRLEGQIEAQSQGGPQPQLQPQSHPRLSHQATTTILTQPTINNNPAQRVRPDDPPPYTPRSTSSLNSVHSVSGTSSHITSTSRGITPLSQLIKQRRRRCGGIFRHIEPGSGSGSGSGAGEGRHGGLELEYEWPYGQNIAVTNKTDGMDGLKDPTGAVGMNDPNGADDGYGLNRSLGNANINAAGDSTGNATGDTNRNGDTNDKGHGDQNANANTNTTGRGTGRGRAWDVPNLTIDTAAVNEIYFRTTQDGQGNIPEPPTPTREYHIKERGRKLFEERRQEVGRYDFECDAEGLGIDVDFGVAASARDATKLAETSEARNQIQGLHNADVNANADRKSTRSPSTYSQWSLESDQSGYNVIRKTHREWYLQNRREFETPPAEQNIRDEHKIEQRIRNPNESWNRLKQKREVGKTDDKSVRSVSSRFGGVERVAGAFGSGTQSVIGRAREIFGSFRMLRRSGERVGRGRAQEVDARGDERVRSLHSSERGGLPEADSLTEQVAKIGLDRGQSGRPKVVRSY